MGLVQCNVASLIWFFVHGADIVSCGMNKKMCLLRQWLRLRKRLVGVSWRSINCVNFTEFPSEILWLNFRLLDPDPWEEQDSFFCWQLARFGRLVFLCCVPFRKNEVEASMRSMEGLATYTPAEVAKHASAHDAWIIISGKVLDITPWLAEHPGGDDVLLAAAGTY